MPDCLGIVDPHLDIQAAILKVKGKPLIHAESITFNPRWILGVTGDGSRYWIHPDSGTVVTIVEK